MKTISGRGYGDQTFHRLCRPNNGNAEKTDNNLTNIRENTKRPITILFYKNMGVSHSEYAILCACLQNKERTVFLLPALLFLH